MPNKNRILTTVLASTLLLPVVSFSQTLPEAVRQAFKTNPELQRDIATRFVAGEQLNQKKAEFFPKVNLTAGVGREKTLNPTSGAVSGTRGYVSLSRREARVEARENVFAGFGDISEVNRTRAHLHSAAYQIVGRAQDVGLDVTEQYINILRYQHNVAAAKHNLALHEKIYGMIRQRSEAGIAREADLEQAKGRLAQAQANLISEEGNLKDAKTAFIRIVGAEPGHLSEPKAPASALPTNLSEAIAIAHKNHPILKSITADVAAAEAQYRSAKSFFYPRVDLVVYGSRNRNLDGIIGPNNDQAALVEASYPIYKGGAIAARVRETAYNIQEANEERNNTMAQLDEHVRLSMNALRVNADRLAADKRHLAASIQTQSAYFEQFKLNKRTLLDVLDAYNETFRAQLDVDASRYDELYSRYRILNSVGSLIQYMEIPVPVEATVPEPHAFRFL